MKRWQIVLTVAVLLAGISFGSMETRAADYKYEWKIATLAPDGVGWAVYVKKVLLKLLSEKSDDELHIDVYWGGTMGDDEDYISKMRIGQLDGGGLSGAGVLMACPEMSVLTLPFLFNDYGEVDYIRSKMRGKFSQLCEKNGYKMLVWGDQDFDQIVSTKIEPRTPDDFKKIKAVNWIGPIEAAVYQKLGASPIPSNVPDVITNMRSGVCDMDIAPSIWWVGAQLYTITKYINPVNIRYMPIMIVIKMETWNSLPDKHKKAIDFEIVDNKREEEFNAFVRKTNKQCYDAMVKYGVKETILTDAEKEKLKELTRPVWDEFVGKEYPKEAYDEILSLLAEYRAEKGVK
ncbi:MAG: TRAP transporter substrate-binding protein DctP [Proteobacteria bacterium]|nr:TRAP transporter substrate-binding protein DctP [Pseudomonadota bacterium]